MRLYTTWAVIKALSLVGIIGVGAVEELVAPDTPDQLSMPATLVAVGTIAAHLCAAVVGLVLVYRSWAQIQDGHHRTTPGRAVGFCFIPFFNLYWIFVAFRGLAVDMSAFCSRQRIQAPGASPGVATAFCVLLLCSWIPLIGILALIANLVLVFIMYLQFANTSAAIAEALADRAAAAPQSSPA